MTAPDPRVGEIEARMSKAANMGEWSAKHPPSRDSWIAIERPHGFTNVTAVVAKGLDHDDAEFIANAPADVAYLLAELRKAHEALARVEVACDLVINNEDGHKPPGPPHPTQQQATALRIRAAVAAANGDPS